MASSATSTSSDSGTTEPITVEKNATIAPVSNISPVKQGGKKQTKRINQNTQEQILESNEDNGTKDRQTRKKNQKCLMFEQIS